MSCICGWPRSPGGTGALSLLDFTAEAGDQVSFGTDVGNSDQSRRLMAQAHAAGTSVSGPVLHCPVNACDAGYHGTSLSLGFLCCGMG